jgi:hypothetical protein
VPYIVHAALDGETVDAYLKARGRCPLADVAMRVRDLAAAIDFAARWGLHHGTLGPRDLAFLADRIGVSGFGLAQAVKAAGIDTNDPSLADDVYALAAMAFELLFGYRYDGGAIRTALASVPGLPVVSLDALALPIRSVAPNEPRPRECRRRPGPRRSMRRWDASSSRPTRRSWLRLERRRRGKSLKSRWICRCSTGRCCSSSLSLPSRSLIRSSPKQSARWSRSAPDERRRRER